MFAQRLVETKQLKASGSDKELTVKDELDELEDSTDLHDRDVEASGANDLDNSEEDIDKFINEHMEMYKKDKPNEDPVEKAKAMLGGENIGAKTTESKETGIEEESLSPDESEESDFE